MGLPEEQSQYWQNQAARILQGPFKWIDSREKKIGLILTFEQNKEFIEKTFWFLLKAIRQEWKGWDQVSEP